jgi:hypothetical protein
LIVERDGEGNLVYRIVLKDRFWSELIRPDNWGVFALIDSVFESALDSKAQSRLFKKPLSQVAQDAKSAIVGFPISSTTTNPRAVAYALYIGGVAEQFKHGLSTVVDNARALEESIVALMKDVARFNSNLLEEGIPPGQDADKYVQEALRAAQERLKTIFWGLRALGWDISAQDAQALATAMFRKGRNNTIEVDPYMSQLLQDIMSRLQQYTTAKLSSLLREKIEGSSLMGGKVSAATDKDEGVVEDVEEEPLDAIDYLFNLTLLDIVQLLGKKPLDYLIEMGGAYSISVSPRELLQNVQRNTRYRISEIFRSRIGRLERKQIDKMREALEKAVYDEILGVDQIVDKRRADLLKDFKEQLEEARKTLSSINVEKRLKELKNLETFSALTAVRVDPQSAGVKGQAASTQVVITGQPPATFSAAPAFSSTWGRNAISMKDNWAASGEGLRKKVDEVEHAGGLLIGLLNETWAWLEEPLRKAVAGYRLTSHSEAVEALAFDVIGLSRLLGEVLRVLEDRASVVTVIKETLGAVDTLKKKLSDDKSELEVDGWLNILHGLQKALLETIPLYSYTIARNGLVESLQQYLSFKSTDEEVVLRTILEAYIEKYWSRIPSLSVQKPTVDELLFPVGSPDSLLNAAGELGFLGLLLDLAAQKPLIDFIVSLRQSLQQNPKFADPTDYSVILDRANMAVEIVRGILRDSYWLVDRGIAEIDYTPRYHWGPKEIEEFIQTYLKDILGPVIKKFWSTGKVSGSRDAAEQWDYNLGMIYSALANNRNYLKEFAQSVVEAMTSHPVHLLGLEHLDLEKRLISRYLLPGESRSLPSAEAPDTIRKLQELFWPFIPGTHNVAQRTLAVFSKRQGHLIVIPEAKALRFYVWPPDDYEQAVRNILNSLKAKPRFADTVKKYEQQLSAAVRNQGLQKMLRELREVWLNAIEVEDIDPLMVALGSLPGVKDVDAYLRYLKQAYEADLKNYNKARSAPAKLYDGLTKFVEEVKEYVRRNIVPVIIVRPANPEAKGDQTPTNAIVQLWGIQVRPSRSPDKYTLEFVPPRTLTLEGKQRDLREMIAKWEDYPLLSEVAYNSLMWDVIVPGALAAQESFEAGRLMPGLYVYLGTHETPPGFDGGVYPLMPWSFGDEWGYGPSGAIRPPLKWSPYKHPLISGAIQMMQLERMGLGRPTEFILPAATLLNMPLEYAEAIINHAFHGTQYRKLPLKLRKAIDEGDYNTLMTALRSMGTAKRAIPSVASLITSHRVLSGLLAHKITPAYEKMRNKIMGFSAPLVAALADFWWEDEENPPDEFTLALGLAGLMHMLSPGSSLLNFRMLFKSVKTYLKSRFGAKPGIFLAMKDPSLSGKQSSLTQFVLNPVLATHLNPDFIRAIEEVLKPGAKKAGISPDKLRETATRIAENFAGSLVAGIYNTSTPTGRLLNLIDRPAQQDAYISRYMAYPVNTAEGMVLDHWKTAKSRATDEHFFPIPQHKMIASLFMLYADYVASDPILLEKYSMDDQGIDWVGMFKDFLVTQLQATSSLEGSQTAKELAALRNAMKALLEDPNDLTNPELSTEGHVVLRKTQEYYVKVYFPSFYLAQIAKFAKQMRANPFRIDEGVRRAMAKIEMTLGDEAAFHTLHDSADYQNLLKLPVSSILEVPEDPVGDVSMLDYDESIYRSIALYIVNSFKRMLIHRYTWYNPEGYEGYRLVPYELWRRGEGAVLTENTPHARIWAENRQKAWEQMKELIKQYQLIPVASHDSPRALLNILEGEEAKVRRRAISLAGVVPGEIVVLRDSEGRIYIAHPVSRSVGSQGMLVKRSTIDDLVEEITRRAHEVYRLASSDVAKNLTGTLKKWAEAFAQKAQNDSALEDPETTQLWTELAVIMAQAAMKSQQIEESYRYKTAGELLNSKEAAQDPYLSYVRALRDIGAVARTPQEADPLIRRFLLAALLRAPRPGDAAYAVRRSNALGYLGPYNPISPASIDDYSGFVRALNYIDNSIDALLEAARRNMREAAAESAARELRVLFSTVFSGIPGEVDRAIAQLKEAYLVKSRLHPRLLKAQAAIGKWIGRFIFLGGIRSWLKNVFVDLPLQFFTMLPQLMERGERFIDTEKTRGVPKGATKLLAFLRTPEGLDLATPKFTEKLLQEYEERAQKDPLKEEIEKNPPFDEYQLLALDVVSELARLDPRILASRVNIYKLGVESKEGWLARIIDIISLGLLRHADQSGRRLLATYFAERIVKQLRAKVLTPEHSMALLEAIYSEIDPERYVARSDELPEGNVVVQTPDQPVVLVGKEFNSYIAPLLSGIATWAANRPGGIEAQDINLYTASAAHFLALGNWPIPETAGGDARLTNIFYQHIAPYLAQEYGIAYSPTLQKWVVPYTTFLRVVGNEVARRVEAILGSFGPGDYPQIERALMKIPGGPLLLMLVRASFPIISGSVRAVAGALAAARIKWGDNATRLLNKYTASAFSGLLASLIFAGIRGLPAVGYLLLFFELMRSIVEEERLESSLERAKKTAQAIWQFLYDTAGLPVKLADELTQIIHDGLLTAITKVDFTRDNAISDIGDIFLVRFMEQFGKAITQGKLEEILRTSMLIGTLMKIFGETPRPGRESITYEWNPLRGRLLEALLGTPHMEYMLGIGEPAVFNENERAYWTDWMLNHVVPGKSPSALQLRAQIIEELEKEPRKVVEIYKRYQYYRKQGVVKRLRDKFDKALSRLKDNPQLMELIVSYLKITRPQSWQLADEITNTAALIRQALSPAWDVIALRLALEHESQRWKEDEPRYLRQRATAGGKELAEILRQTVQQYDRSNGTNYARKLYSIADKIRKQSRLEAYSTLAVLADNKEIPEEIVLRFILAAEVYGLLGQTVNRRASQIKKIKPGLQGSETVKPGLRSPRPSPGLSPEQRELIERSVEAAGAEDELGE